MTATVGYRTDGAIRATPGRPNPRRTGGGRKKKAQRPTSPAQEQETNS